MRLVRFASLSLLLVAAACGDDDGGGGGADAGDEVDSGPDIDADDRPTSGTCGIAVNLEALLGTQKNGLPEELPSAVFSNPDGSLIGVESLDIQGRAQRTDCVRDTIVSLVVEPEYGLTGETGPLPVTTPGFVITFANVQPNDTAQVGALPDPLGDEDPEVGTINVSIPADLSGFGASPPTQWYVSAGPRCRDNNSFPVNPAGASTTAMLTIYESCVEPDGNVNIYAYATRNGEGVAYAALTGVDADATPDTALTAWTPADLATAAVGSNLDTSTFGYLDAHQAIATVPLVATGDDYSRGSLTVARTYNGMPSEVATGGSYTQVTASSNSSEFALQNFTENPRVSQVAVSSPAQATSVVDMSSALPNIREIVLSLPTGLPTLNFVTEQPPDGAQAGAATFIVSDNFVSEPPVAFWIVISGDVSSGSITAPPLSEESLAAILPDDRSLSFLVAVGSLWAFDFQSYSDLINSEGLDPVGLTGLSIFLRSAEGPPIVEADLPARMPRDAAASAARSLWLNRNATFFFEL